MSNIIFTRNTEAIQADAGDFNPLKVSGIYDCVIERASLQTRPDSKATSIVLTIKTSEGEEATIYDGLSITQNDGQEHFQQKVVNALLTI
jgi:hypothetical protein